MSRMTSACKRGRCDGCSYPDWCEHSCHVPAAQGDLLAGEGQARATDPPTSKEAARFIGAKANTARVKLMLAHHAQPAGMTDEEACLVAGLSLRSEYATRCSELMRMGFLADTGTTRPSMESGLARRVLKITEAGEAALDRRKQ